MVDFRVSDQEGVTLIEAVGRVDSMNANQFGSSLIAVIDQGKTEIVLDLSQVDYMSSAGLRELVAGVKKVRKSSGDMRISNPSPRVREVMEMAGLDTIFLIFDSQVEAVESF